VKIGNIQQNVLAETESQLSAYMKRANVHGALLPYLDQDSWRVGSKSHFWNPFIINYGVVPAKGCQLLFWI
jgi:hypothetical protein